MKLKKKNTDHHHDKYITTPEFNKLRSKNFAARLKQANLASKTDIASFVRKTDIDNKLSGFNKRINSNKTKNVLVENELKKLKTFDSSLFIGQSYFNDDGSQLYLKFQSIYKTITTFSVLKNIISKFESKGLLNKKFRPLYTRKKIIYPKLQWNKSRLRLRFEGSCLKQEDTTPITPNNVILETEYSINFSRSKIKFCLSLHYNGSNSFLFVNATKIHHFKARGSEIKKYPLYLGNISKDFTANNMKKQD